MLNIGNKTFMNLQEAVGWLLENNALPFQSTANYVGNTEIAMSTLVNPSPAKVRVGSLIFFADSKVSTVTGVTSNSFIVSDQYNDLVDDIVYVSNVALNASGHLIVTLSNGDTIDAGLIKQVTGFSINASQHLIVSYNDSTTTDLGAIFSGNITISGNLTVSGGISGNAITGTTVTGTSVSGDSIIENMSSDYSFRLDSSRVDANLTVTPVYAGIVKNGNKLTLVLFMTIKRTGDLSAGYYLDLFAGFRLPQSLNDKLIPYTLSPFNNVMDNKKLPLFATYNQSTDRHVLLLKSTYGGRPYLALNVYALDTLTLDTTYNFRYEATFLLGDNLAS